MHPYLTPDLPENVNISPKICKISKGLAFVVFELNKFHSVHEGVRDKHRRAAWVFLSHSKAEI